MKPLEDLKELTEKVYEHNTDGKTLAALSKIFAKDLIQERRFGNMTFNQIQDAFRIGVRFSDFEPFINIRTFYKWVYAHKKVVDDATYQVEKLDMPKEKVPFYQEQIKLLK
jgi:site-specific recombinase XerD